MFRRDIDVAINEGQKYLKIDLLWHCQIGPIDIYNREGPSKATEISEKDKIKHKQQTIC